MLRRVIAVLLRSDSIGAPTATHAMTLSDTPDPDSLLALYAAAHRDDGRDFARRAFDHLRVQLAFDAGTIVTSFADQPSYVDAHFDGFADPGAILASWGPVAHLDELSPRLLSQPLRAQRQDIDAPEIADARFAPLRAHLARFRITYSACIAVPADGGRTMTVLILVRHDPTRRYTDRELQRLEQHAPHVAQAQAICRSLALSRSPGIGLGQLPVALVGHDGAVTQTTPAFVALFWPQQPPRTNRLDAACMAAIRDGRAWPLPGGAHSLHALPDGDGSWLLRIRATSRADRLSAREREIARHFAEGMGYKEVAQRTGLAPATVRNHLRNVYAKLGVDNRATLVAAMQ